MIIKSLFSREMIYFLVLLSALVAVRVVYYKQTPHLPGLSIVVYNGDQGFYRRSATSFSSGNWLIKKGDISRGPGYIYFLGIMYKVSGNSYVFVRFIQHLLGVLTGLFIFFLGKRLFDRKKGLIAAFLYAFYFPSVCFEGTLLMSSLLTFLVTFGLWCFIKAIQDNNRKFYFLSGLMYGWAFLCRPNNILIPIFLVLYLVLKKINRRLVVYFLTGLFLLFSLLMVRNHLAGGKLFNISTQAREVILSSHHHDADGVSWSRPQSRQKQRVLMESRENVVSFISFVLTDIYWHFGKWTKIQMFKIYAYFFGYEFSQFIKFDVLRTNVPFLRLPYIPFGVLSCIGLLGIFFLIRNRRKQNNMFILSYFLVVVLGSIIFYIASRFRQPAMPLFCLFAAYAVCNLPGYFRSINLIGRTGLVLLFIGVSIVLNWGPKKQEFNQKFAEDTLFHWHNIDLLDEDGAIDQLTLLAQQRPDSSKIALYLGVAYSRKNDLKNAIRWLERAMEMEYSSTLLYSVLGRCYVQAGRYDKKTIWLLETSLKLKPDDTRSSDALAHCYLKLGQNEKALRIWENNIENYPDNYTSYYNLGLYYEKRGNLELAYQNMKQSLQLMPGNEKILTALERIKQAISVRKK